jgi:hypothetical protein
MSMHLKLSKVGLALALGTGAALIAAGQAAAARAVLSGTHSAGEVAGACLKAGGAFTSSSNGSYSCEAKNGAVRCDAHGNCVGYCDKCADTTKGGLNGALRPPASAGTASTAGSSTATRHRPPLNAVGGLRASGGITGGASHPVVLERSAGHSGGGRH